LTPWGIDAPTGYAYIRTVGKINQIICNSAIPNVTPAKAPGKVLGKEAGGFKEGMGTTTSGSVGGIPLIGSATTTTPTGSNGHSVGANGDPQDLAAAIFMWPGSTLELLQCLYELLLILIVLYILGNVLESVLYKDNPENVLKKFRAKWTTVALGLAIAFLGAYLLKEWCLLLPLIIAFLAALLWLFLGGKRHQNKEVTKTAYTATRETKIPAGPGKISRNEIVKERTDLMITEEKKGESK
jgi:hypothetical protein